MKTCLDCEKRDSCKKLCKSMEKFLNRETKSFSFRWTRPKFLEVDLTNDFEFPNIMAAKSYRAWIYELYFLDNKSVEEISHQLPLEVDTIEDILHQIRENVDKVDNKNKREILWEHLVNGSDVVKTHRRTGFSKVYIYRVLKEYIYYWNVDS
jgi:hypothetical protein